MTTAGNPNTQTDPRGSQGNGSIVRGVESATVTNPTLGNGDGTYAVDVTSVRTIGDTSYVVGVSHDGAYKASVSSVSGNTVTVLLEEPDGAGALTTAADGDAIGDLEVTVLS